MSPPQPLQSLHRRLAWLGLARRCARWLCGLSLLLVLLLWVLAAIMAIDVLFEMDGLQRMVVTVLAACLLAWSVYRYVRPYFGWHESRTDLAVLVEKLHGIDSDLVAAIEFAGPAAASWGSATLREQVIQSVADRECQLQMARAVDRRDVAGKLRSLLITLTLAVLVVAVFPVHAKVFLQRLAWVDTHYPSRTIIESIAVNGQTVLVPADGHTPRPMRCAERGPVEFLVCCTRAAPASGELRIASASGSPQRHVPLERQDGTDVNGGTQTVRYVAQLPTLLDSLNYQIYLGDAWTNPAVIEMIPLPQITIHTRVTPPAYAGSQEHALAQSGTYRLTALEGSQVELSVSGDNGKPLQAVWAELQTAGKSERIELAKEDAGGWRWQLDGRMFPPLQSLQDNIRFVVHATDQDGLQPLQLPHGEIRIQSDLPPDAVAATIHRVVTPDAKPRVAYRVHDDFAVARLRLQVQIQRKNEVRDEAEDADVPPEVHWQALELGTAPMTRADLPLVDRTELDLKPYLLQKGDRIKVTLEVTDYRGSAPGAATMSKPLYLEISDQAGVLAAILEADQRTEEDLNEMIERQLGLGESP